MVQSVLSEDVFAGVAWSVADTLCALEKLCEGRPLCDADRNSIKETVGFVNSLLLPPEDHFSKEFRRFSLFCEMFVTQDPQPDLFTLAQDLNGICQSDPIPLDGKQLVNIQEKVLNILKIINLCRWRG
ncbi:MAG: hypothetical protein Q7K26_01025 [bacterium]|nr:hypothetical protein [bacterium]